MESFFFSGPFEIGSVAGPVLGGQFVMPERMLRRQNGVQTSPDQERTEKERAVDHFAVCFLVTSSPLVTGHLCIEPNFPPSNHPSADLDIAPSDQPIVTLRWSFPPSGAQKVRRVVYHSQNLLNPFHVHANPTFGREIRLSIHVLERWFRENQSDGCPALTEAWLLPGYVLRQDGSLEQGNKRWVPVKTVHLSGVISQSGSMPCRISEAHAH
ncbi:hypothetical protein V8E55_012006 [Tylopilus felleus]